MAIDAEFRSRTGFALLMITAFGLSLTVLWIGRVIFLLLFAAMIGAVLLTAVADWIHKRLRIHTGVALALFLVSLLALVALGVWLQGTTIVQQFTELEVQLPAAARQSLARLEHYSWGQWLLSRSPDQQQIQNGFDYAISRIGNIVVSSATVLAGLVIVFSLSMYLAVEPGMYFHGVRRLTPAVYREQFDACAASVKKVLQSWVLAKLISMSMVGVLISIGLRIVGVPLAGSLGIIAALLTFIPNVGPIVSVVPALLLAMSISPTTALLAAMVFAIVFVLEGYVVTPVLERNIVRLPPAVTLTMQLLLAAIAGPVGVALAAPLAAAILGILDVLVPQEPDAPPRPRFRRPGPLRLRIRPSRTSRAA